VSFLPRQHLQRRRISKPSACVCDPGLFGVLEPAAGTDGVYACTACAPGSFSDAKNASVCALCAAGKFSTARGAPTGDTCLACASGSVTLELWSPA
jgi:hypothetical protein